ncbi:MAG: histidine phosphatase family protein [Lachnospiraceae bacterium]|nr:histidine phosphatase family protein [Lachnospiraceae bacterium]
MKLYVIRHGETEWNKTGRLQGNRDVPLNEAGLQQAIEAREALRHFEFDVVYSSPLVRAAQTARIIVEGSQKPVFYDERLRERCFGTLEGKLAGSYDYVELWDHEKDYDYGGESVSVFFKRVGSFLDDLKKTQPEGNVLLVCHGGTMRAVESYFHGIMDAKRTAGFFSKNAEVRTYEL